MIEFCSILEVKETSTIRFEVNPLLDTKDRRGCRTGEMWDDLPNGGVCTVKGHTQTTVLAPPDDSSCCIPPPTAGAGIPLLTAGGPPSSHLSHSAGAKK